MHVEELKLPEIHSEELRGGFPAGQRTCLVVDVRFNFQIRFGKTGLWDGIMIHSLFCLCAYMWGQFADIVFEYSAAVVRKL